MVTIRSRRVAWLATVFLLTFARSALAAAPSQKAVLCLIAEAPSNAYYTALYRGFREELDRQLPNAVLLYSENLDLPQFDSPQYRRELTRWLRYKYRDVQFDAVMVAGSPALRYLMSERLWPEVPTYFVSANDKVVRDMTLPPNVTGQTVVLSLPDTAFLIGQLFPRTRKVALVANPAGRDTYRPGMADELQALTARYQLIDLRGLPVEQVRQAISRLPDDAVIYHQTYTLDGTGRRFDPYLALNLALQRANRPVFVDYAAFVGTGAVGGAGIDSAALGRYGARDMARLLQGEAPSSIPLRRRSFGPVVDARALDRWKVDPAHLPPATTILFREPTEWERYRGEILGTAALILTLSLLILALLLERTRRERAVAESRQRLSQLAHLNRGASAMVYSAAIAHELNQPLAAIMSNAEASELFLRADPPNLAQAREALADIKRDDRRAAEIIRRMRGMLKRTDQVAVPVDMRHVVTDAATFIAPEVRMRQATLRTALPDLALPVQGDPVQLQQVLINLVINAMDAMDALPAPERVVEIRADEPAQQGGWVKLHVTDRGPGFAGDIGQVFDSFITTKEHGSGLGLAITAAIVREHGGRIQARNLSPFGAEVSFSLPLAQAGSTKRGN